MRQKEEFLVTLINCISNVKLDNKTSPCRDFVIQQTNGYINAGRIASMMMLDNAIIQTFQDGELYLIAKALKKYDKEYKYFNRIELEKYFTEEDSIVAYSFSTEYDNRIVEIDAIKKPQSKTNEWIGVLTYEQIVELITNNLIRYNMNTQRLPKMFMQNGTSVFLADINEKSVDEICNAVLDDEFESNTITLNIIREDEETFENESKDQFKLIIDTEKHNIDIIDGMHRILGIAKAYTERQKDIERGMADEQIKGSMAVSIKNLSEDEAKKFIYQESLANSQNQSTSDLFNPNSNLRRYFTSLNSLGGSSKQNVLYGKITTSGDEDKVSVSFLLGLISRLSYSEKLQTLIAKTLDLTTCVNSTVEYLNCVYEEMRADKKWYKENQNILESQCVIGGLIVRYIDYATKTGNLMFDKPLVYDFIDKAKANTKQLIFDFPLHSRIQIQDFKRMYL